MWAVDGTGADFLMLVMVLTKHEMVSRSPAIYEPKGVFKALLPHREEQRGHTGFL